LPPNSNKGSQRTIEDDSPEKKQEAQAAQSSAGDDFDRTWKCTPVPKVVREAVKTTNVTAAERMVKEKAVNIETLST
jgi:hypothetical protein